MGKDRQIIEEIKIIKKLINTIIFYALQDKGFLIKRESLKDVNVDVLKQILEELPCVTQTGECEDGLVVITRNPVL